MADVFISYSVKDKELAEFLHKHLSNEGLKVFRAPISVKPGERWDKKILDNLNKSPWVLFLASKAACKSAIVQQEVGIALGSQKNLVPIVWNMNPEELPGFVKNMQALDLRKKTLDEVTEQILEISKRIKGSKWMWYLVAGLVIAGIILLLRKK